MSKLFVFDVETTGVKFWKNGIHQISGLIVINGQIADRFNYKVAPNAGAEIDPEALTVGNVTLDQIRAYPPMQAVYESLTGLLTKYVDKCDKKDKMFLVGYNCAAFDIPFLRAFFVQNGDKYFGSYFYPNPIDVYVLASAALMDERGDMPDFKLGSVAKKLGAKVDSKKLHDALYDVELTYNIYTKLQTAVIQDGLFGKE